jgi:hypothetical protein
MRKACVVVLVLLGMLVNTAFAQKPAVVTDSDPGWKRIGQVTASFKKQNESISVLGADEFTALKIKVTEAPIHIERVQVFYESGDMEEIQVGHKLQSGAESGAIRLKEPYRDIKKIAFTYNTLPNTDGEKADVEVFGLKTNQKEHSDAYLEKKAEDAEDEVEEAGREVKQEVDEAGREVKEEANEAERELEEESNEAKVKAERTEEDIEEGSDDLGDDISEAAAKVMADIKDRRHQTKVGPKGQIIFITDDTRYYYIDNDGNKVFVSEAQLKIKKDDDK